MTSQDAVILFHASSHAIRAEKLLKDRGIDCRLTPVPRHLSSDCGVCIRLDRAACPAAQKVLDDSPVEVAAYHDLA